ncbi:hypothetical protein [Streptomyces sp. NPDC048606]|uniref:hypothetical protein n=1 Tax=Streptomyces sp. NPDC048606 TaxID=3154726 RepID=UPI00343B5F45
MTATTRTVTTPHVTPESGAAGAPRTVRVLRPGVAVTPLRAGLHLRGRRGSVTLEGSAALPVLWRSLEGPLRAGRLDDAVASLEPGSSTRRAVETLIGQLEEHDLLVARPADAHDTVANPVERWTAATSERPGAAAAALASTRFEVVAGAPDGELARAAGRALELGGPTVTYTADPLLPADRILLRTRVTSAEPRTAPVAVAAGLCGGTGWVTAPGSAAQARSDAAALEARLAPGGPGATPASAALLGSAAAHRLLCAAARLPDPAFEGGDERLLPGLPAVLLAEARPARSDYVTWLGPERIDADRRAELGPADTLADALRRLAALGDERCGALPAPLPEDLRQMPVPLASCELPGATPPGVTVVAGAPRLDLARLEAFCRVAESLLGPEGLSVGATPGHARGRALREAAARHLPSAITAPPLPSGPWERHPQLRHWWTTLTARLAVPARLEVRRLAPDREAYLAVVHRRMPDGGAEPVLGRAVEATPGDAAAFAALAAVAAASDTSAAPALGVTRVASVRASGGAVAPLASAEVRTAAWEDDGWTDGWLAALAEREEALLDALSRLPKLPPTEEATHADDHQLLSLVRAFGFTVLHTPQETR